MRLVDPEGGAEVMLTGVEASLIRLYAGDVDEIEGLVEQTPQGRTITFRAPLRAQRVLLTLTAA